MSEDPVVILANVSGTFVGTPVDPISSFAVVDDTMSFVPDPTNFSAGAFTPLKKDVEGNLATRALTFTDESSFRDDFTVATIYSSLAGTVTFTSGSTYVSGSGTLFLSELTKECYVKNSFAAEEFYTQVLDVQNDSELTLVEPYPGTTATGIADKSLWKLKIDTGTSISISGTICIVAAGTVNASAVEILHVGDYLPLNVGAVMHITQRIANQSWYFGLGDGAFGSAENQAYVVFDGVDNTRVKLVTSIASNDIETTEVTLPYEIISSNDAYYQIEVGTDRVSLLVDDARIAQHRTHLPGPYSAMDLRAGCVNTGVPISNSEMHLDVAFMSNFDQVQIGAFFKGDELRMRVAPAPLSSGTLVPASAIDTILLEPNMNRKGVTIYNNSSAFMYMMLGYGASTTNFTVKMAPDSYYEVPFSYTGPINAMWSSATGSAAITELF